MLDTYLFRLRFTIRMAILLYVIFLQSCYWTEHFQTVINFPSGSVSEICKTIFWKQKIVFRLHSTWICRLRIIYCILNSILNIVDFFTRESLKGTQSLIGAMAAEDLPSFIICRTSILSAIVIYLWFEVCSDEAGSLKAIVGRWNIRIINKYEITKEHAVK